MYNFLFILVYKEIVNALKLCTYCWKVFAAKIVYHSEHLKFGKRKEQKLPHKAFHTLWREKGKN